jgi:hypothetical protein
MSALVCTMFWIYWLTVYREEIVDTFKLKNVDTAYDVLMTTLTYAYFVFTLFSYYLLIKKIS